MQQGLALYSRAGAECVLAVEAIRGGAHNHLCPSQPGEPADASKIPARFQHVWISETESDIGLV